MQKNLEMGLDTFGDVTEDAEGRPLSHQQVLRNVVDEAVLADQVGLDFFGVGEHHRADFAVSAPAVVLTDIAGQTNDSHLRPPATVRTSYDPARDFQRVAPPTHTWQSSDEIQHRPGPSH